MTKNTLRLLVVLGTCMFATNEIYAAGLFNKITGAFNGCRRQTKARMVDPSIKAIHDYVIEPWTPPVLKKAITNLVVSRKVQIGVGLLLTTVIAHELMHTYCPWYQSTEFNTAIETQKAQAMALLGDGYNAMIDQAYAQLKADPICEAPIYEAAVCRSTVCTLADVDPASITPDALNIFMEKAVDAAAQVVSTLQDVKP